MKQVGGLMDRHDAPDVLKHGPAVQFQCDGLFLSSILPLSLTLAQSSRRVSIQTSGTEAFLPLTINGMYKIRGGAE